MNRPRTPHAILAAAAFVAAAVLASRAQGTPRPRYHVAGDNYHLALMSDGPSSCGGQLSVWAPQAEYHSSAVRLKVASLGS